MQNRLFCCSVYVCLKKSEEKNRLKIFYRHCENFPNVCSWQKPAFRSSWTHHSTTETDLRQNLHFTFPWWPVRYITFYKTWSLNINGTFQAFIIIDPLNWLYLPLNVHATLYSGKRNLSWLLQNKKQGRTLPSKKRV